MTHMKETKTPIAFQLVNAYGMIFNSYRTLAEAQNAQTTQFWKNGDTYNIQPVYAS